MKIPGEEIKPKIPLILSILSILLICSRMQPDRPLDQRVSVSDGVPAAAGVDVSRLLGLGVASSTIFFDL